MNTPIKTKTGGGGYSIKLSSNADSIHVAGIGAVAVGFDECKQLFKAIFIDSAITNVQVTRLALRTKAQLELPARTTPRIVVLEKG